MNFIELTTPIGDKIMVNMDMVVEILPPTIICNGGPIGCNRLLYNFEINGDYAHSNVRESSAEILEKICTNGKPA